jgi:hypothetical protein
MVPSILFILNGHVLTLHPQELEIFKAIDVVEAFNFMVLGVVSIV